MTCKRPPLASAGGGVGVPREPALALPPPRLPGTDAAAALRAGRRRAVAVSGAAAVRPGEGVPPPFPIRGTKETAP